MKTTAKTAFALLAMLAASTLWAVEVTSEQAKTAVGRWIAIGPDRMESRFKSAEAETTKTFRNAAGRTVYHAVNLKGGGFVVTSGDTRISPIIAFSSTGRFSGDERGPFHALLRNNMGSAMAAVDRLEKANKSGMEYASSNPLAAAMSEWAALLPPKASSGDHGPSMGGSQKASVSDVRVNKLLKTEWSQDWCYIYNGASTCNVYNYYTPNNYECGCVATAGAQVMMRWKKPSASIAQFSNTCAVDGKSVTKKSIAGAFDWDNMFLKWDTSGGPLPDTQIKAVSMLTYNVGVAVKMDWGADGSGAFEKNLVGAFKDVFGYKSAVYMYYDLDTLNKNVERPSDMEARLADFDNAVYASLDAKMPVVMGIKDKTSNPDITFGHAIVADGYGYTSGKRYTHLNFGWEGMDDAWYYLPNDSMLTAEANGLDWSEIECIVFNVHPTAAGDVISGRVLDASGSAVSGADVTLYDSGNNAKKTVATDSKGIYSFRITAKGSYTVRAAHSATSEQPSTSVSISMLSKDGSFIQGSNMTGNRWGVDVQFPTWTPPVSRTLTLTPNNKSYGTVSGGGKYMAGTVVPLKASAKSGYAFAGWFTDKACTVKLNPTGYDNRAPEIQVAMPSANTTIYAKFITKADAKKSLKFTSSTKALATTPKKSMSGYEFSLSLGAASATLVTFSAKGLPYGLKLDPATGKITGTPVKPGYYDVTITVTDAAGNKITQIVKLTLGVLSWSKGDYYGTAYPFGKGDRPGYFTFNVAANGKVSGKVTYKGKAYSFKSECNYSSKLRLLFKPQITIGSKTFSPGYITIAQRTLALGGVVVEEGNDDNGLVLVQRPTGVVTETGRLAELIGQEFVLTKDSNYSPNLLDGDEIVVRVVDGDTVFMRGTIQGKTLYGTSVPLRVENYLKRGNGNCYILSAYLFDESLNYYRTIRIQATLYPQWSEERGVYYVLNPSCYIMEEE